MPSQTITFDEETLEKLKELETYILEQVKREAERAKEKMRWSFSKKVVWVLKEGFEAAALREKIVELEEEKAELAEKVEKLEKSSKKRKTRKK